MDQLKVFLAVLKKQHFWVMGGLALVVGLIGWFVATSKLRAEYAANRSKVEAEFKELDQLRSQERENQDWSVGVQAETAVLKVKVKDAWEDVYAEQRDKVLKWPKVLGPDFLQIVPELLPNEDIPVDQRERYWNYVQEEFPELLKIVDARNYADKVDATIAPQPRAAGGRKPPVAEVADDHDYKVVWDGKNQESIETRLNWSSTPTTQEVRRTQEDLWVYQALLAIIARLNERADGHHNAKVKEIRSMLIGREAAVEFQAGMAEGRIEHPESAVVQPGAPGMHAPPAPGQPNAAAAARGGPTGAGLKDKDSDEGRYVDEKGVPVTAATAAPEFKRMPVVMRLLMDQKEISRLLVECANSPLPVEVRQFRIPGARNVSSLGGTKAPVRPRPVVGGAEEERDKNPYDVVVDVYGIIYIFNPPDMAKLATGKAVETTDAAETPAGDAVEEPAADGVEADAEQPGGDRAPAAKPAADDGAPGDAAEAAPAGDAEGAAKEPADDAAPDADQAAEKPAEAMPEEDN
jgi:hypothetical protein